MKIAVASGKGGTGKTMVAVNLALAASEGEAVQLIDCDVEEPNAHLFLNPQIEHRRTVEKLLPRVDGERCSRCGACAKACEFGALAVLGDTVLVYDELCHGCGLCARVCPTDAIHEIPHALGIVESGTARGIAFAQGVLHPGEAMATPIIHELKHEADGNRLVVFDAPPGTGCPVIAVLKDADLALLVTEPTPFGLHDLKAAIGVARVLEVPVAVVLNRADLGNDDVEGYCDMQGIPILLHIPFDREIAARYATGETLVDGDPRWKRRFRNLREHLAEVLP